ncbi:MAG TPA: DinB family protein [Candidatus Angelobacter sp.]|nr:DinB family protein [Candidatus Angelobacter sp.]
MSGSFAKIACVNALNATLIQDFTRNYRNSARTIHDLVDPLSDEQIWTRPYPYGNSIGNLILHLTGNLNNYFGAELGGTGYVRNRPLEFAETSRIPKDELLKRFDDAIAVVADVLRQQSEGDWSAPYSAKGMEEITNRFSAFLHCAAHVYHHTGQMMYLVKELQK